jgi:glycosyltransferase involved in cell wall biosynthesis
MAVNNKLLIAHSIASMDQRSGGTTTALFDILKEQSKFVNLELYTINSDEQIDIPIQNLKLFSEDTTFLDYSSSLQVKLKQSNADIFHGHAIWNLPIHQMAKVARVRKKPYIISIHGMLEPWSLEQSVLKKKIAMCLYQKNDLQNASCIHATAESEALHVRKLGFKNPIAIIPNGISTKEYPLKIFNHISGKKKRALFLSRIHQKKGIEILLQAWSQIAKNLRTNWEIAIVGNGDPDYINILNNKINKLELHDQIRIYNAKYGDEKIEMYHSADLFVLPTYSENFGMVVAEALSCGLPVITTKGTPWKDLEECNAGSWIDIESSQLQRTLESYLQKDLSELEKMGRNGRKLVEKKYSIESVGQKFEDLYDWILNKTEIPDFVI